MNRADLGIFASRDGDVRKHHGGAAEDVIFQGHALIDRDVVLDLDVIADHDVVPDIDILAENAMTADPGAALDVAVVPYFRAFADDDVVVEAGRLMDIMIMFGHGLFPALG